MTVLQDRYFLYFAGTENRDIASRLDDGEICVLGTVLRVELIHHASMCAVVGVLGPLDTGAAYTAAHDCDDFVIGHICIRFLSVCIKGKVSAESFNEGLSRYLFRAHLDALNAVGLCCLKLLSQIIFVQAQSLADGFDIELFCGTEVNESQRIAKSVSVYCARTLDARKNITIVIGNGNGEGITVKISCSSFFFYEPTTKEVFINVESADEEEREKINQYVKDNSTSVSENLVPLKFLQSIVSYGCEKWNPNYI